MSGDNKTTSTQATQQQAKTKAGPWAPAQRPLKNLLQDASGIEPVDFSGYQPQIQSYIDSTLSGQSNPHLQGLLDTVSDTASNTVGSRFSAAGRSFSPSHAAALGKAVTQGLSPYLFQNYGMERAALPGLFGMAAGLPYAGLGAQRDFMLPIAQLGQQGTSNTTGNMTGTQGQTSDPLQTGIGAGLGTLGILSMGSSGGLGGALGTGLAGLLSDRRLKEDIEQVGSLFDGTPVYRFRYKGHPATIIGLMADDVEKRAPEAVVENSDGYKFVDYKLATEGALAQ